MTRLWASMELLIKKFCTKGLVQFGSVIVKFILVLSINSNIFSLVASILIFLNFFSLLSSIESIIDSDNSIRNIVVLFCKLILWSDYSNIIIDHYFLWTFTWNRYSAFVVIHIVLPISNVQFFKNFTINFRRIVNQWSIIPVFHNFSVNDWRRNCCRLRVSEWSIFVANVCYNRVARRWRIIFIEYLIDFE